jgi:HEAT repeat protein
LFGRPVRLIVVLTVFAVPSHVESAETKYGGKTISQYIDTINSSKDEEARLESMQALDAIGPEASVALPTMLKVLKDQKNPSDLRQVAASAIGHLGSAGQSAKAELITILESKSDSSFATKFDVRFAILHSLGHFNDIDKLTSVLEAKGEYPPQVRAAAAHTMGELNSTDRRIIAPLTKALRDIPMVQYAALSALTMAGTLARDARPEFKHILKSEAELGNRVQAAIALSNFRSDAPEVVPFLIEMIGDPKNGALRRGMAVALGRFGPDAASAVPVLTSLLKQEGDLELQQLAAYSLGQIGSAGAAATPELLVILEQGTTTRNRAEAARALGATDADPNVALNPLIHSLKTDESPLVRQTAGSALGIVGRRSIEAVKALIKSLLGKHLLMCLSEPSDHDADHRDLNDGSTAFDRVLIVAV